MSTSEAGVLRLPRATEILSAYFAAVAAGLVGPDESGPPPHVGPYARDAQIALIAIASAAHVGQEKERLELLRAGAGLLSSSAHQISRSVGD